VRKIRSAKHKKKRAEAVGVGKLRKSENTKQTGISFPNVCVLGCGKSRSDYLPANDFESAHLFAGFFFYSFFHPNRASFSGFPFK